MIAKSNVALPVVLSAFLFGCSAIPTTPGGQTVELVTEKPPGNCKPLGDAVGSQGNWFTGDYTSNKNLLIGARNDLRNKETTSGSRIQAIPMHGAARARQIRPCWASSIAVSNAAPCSKNSVPIKSLRAREQRTGLEHVHQSLLQQRLPRLRCGH